MFTTKYVQDNHANSQTDFYIVHGTKAYLLAQLCKTKGLGQRSDSLQVRLSAARDPVGLRFSASAQTRHGAHKPTM
jgi:hypothetical protein